MAEIQLIMHHSIVFQNKKLGQMNFFTLELGNISMAGKFFDKVPSDRDAFLQVLYNLMKEPKKSKDDIALLSDSVLEKMGKTLLTESHLIDRYEILKRGKGNFFSKFRRLFKDLVDEEKKSKEKLINKFNPSLLKSIYDVFKDNRTQLYKSQIADMTNSGYPHIPYDLRKTSLEHITDLNKAAYELMGWDVIKNIERAQKETYAASNMLDFSRSLINSSKYPWGMNKQFIEDMQHQIFVSNKFLTEHEEMQKISLMSNSFIAPPELNFKETLDNIHNLYLRSEGIDAIVRDKITAFSGMSISDAELLTRQKNSATYAA